LFLDSGKIYLYSIFFFNFFATFMVCGDLLDLEPLGFLGTIAYFAMRLTKCLKAFLRLGGVIALYGL
jgi:hypothetical protein